MKLLENNSKLIKSKIKNSINSNLLNKIISNSLFSKNSFNFTNLNNIKINKNIVYKLSKSFCSNTEENEFKNADIIKFTYKCNKDNTIMKAEAPEGMNLLKAAHLNNIDLEGACDCSLACSTCHVILEQEIFDSIPPAEENEDDLLDNAFGLSHTSRLGCQIKLTKQFNGTVVTLPSATRNLYVDGYKPKPH